MKKASNCPLCGSKMIRKRKINSDYILLECEECFLVWDSNTDFKSNLIYDQGYFKNNNYKGGYANYFEGAKINSRTFSDRLKAIERKLGKKGKVLDLGCALGNFLISAKKHGWNDSYGLDISEFAVLFAREKGLKVFQGKIKDLPKSLVDFDVITLQDVIEHLDDPFTDLERVYKLLKPGGFVFIVTPDIKSIWARVLGPYWYHYKKDEHLFYFSGKSISLALKKAGFADIDIKKTYHTMSLEYIFNRLRFYSLPIFSTLSELTKKSRLNNKLLKLYTGEMEVWAKKP